MVPDLKKYEFEEVQERRKNRSVVSRTLVAFSLI
jgi:hypothetical protein